MLLFIAVTNETNAPVKVIHTICVVNCRYVSITSVTRVLQSIISGLPRDWKRPPGRLRRTWLRTIEQDLRPLNIGLVSAWQRAQVEADSGNGYAPGWGMLLMMMMMMTMSRETFRGSNAVSCDFVSYTVN